MFTDDKMDAYDCLRVSKVLYEGLCSHIGTRTEVIIRRELMDMEEIIRNSKGVNEGTICMHSSSHREGFRLKSSDQDIMFWCKRYNIICDVSNSVDFYPCTMLMEHFVTPPGFVKLKLLTPAICFIIKCSVVMHMNNYYISSTKFRNTMHHTLTNSGVFTEKLRLHGPCSNFYWGGHEMDYSLCILVASEYWPQTAQPLIARCQLKQWPTQTLLREILYIYIYSMDVTLCP